MALSLNKHKLDNLAGDIWKSAERLRGKFKAYEYQSVILPIIVIRRLECVLLDWRRAKRAEVIKKRPKLTEKELGKMVKDNFLKPKCACPSFGLIETILQSAALRRPELKLLVKSLDSGSLNTGR
jgi:type I restriction enzyme M protein